MSGQTAVPNQPPPVRGGAAWRLTQPARRHPDAVVFVALLVLVFASKANILNAPHYWDEAFWAAAAHRLSEVGLVKALPGFRPADVFVGHPPVLFVTLAVLRRWCGDGLWVSHVLILCFAFLGVYFTYRLGSFLYGRTAGIFAALFLWLSPMYFAQSGMFLGDVPVAACGVMAIYFGLRRAYVPYVLCATYLVLIKETAAAIIAAFVVYLLLIERRQPRHALREAVKYVAPLLALASFDVWQKIATGNFCCIGFDLAESASGVWRDKLRNIPQWLFCRQQRFVLTGLTVVNLVAMAGSRRRREVALFALIFFLSSFPFVFIYFLPRYLLPALPYFYILGAWSLTALIGSKTLRLAAASVIIAASIFSLSETRLHGTSEWSMTYLDVVRTSQATAAYIEERYPDARVLTSWPDTAYLRDPSLGYVKAPIKTVHSSGETRLEQFDLLLISRPSAPNDALRAYAARETATGTLRVLRRVETNGILSELYERIADGG